MTMLISRSRPTTGSILAALATRSSLNCSNSFTWIRSSFFVPISPHCRFSTAWVNSAVRSTPAQKSVSPAAQPSNRSIDSSRWMGRMTRLPAHLASLADSRRILFAFPVHPWGRGRSVAPRPSSRAVRLRKSPWSAPQLRSSSPAMPGLSDRASSKCPDPTQLCPMARASSPLRRRISRVLSSNPTLLPPLPENFSRGDEKIYRKRKKGIAFSGIHARIRMYPILDTPSHT